MSYQIFFVPLQCDKETQANIEIMRHGHHQGRWRTHNKRNNNLEVAPDTNQGNKTMKKAVFPNGIAINVTDEQAAKIINIQNANRTHERLMKSNDYREKYGLNTIVLYELGAQCTAYGQSATEIAKATGRTIDHQKGIDIVTFPKTSEDIYLPRLVREGYKIVIIKE